MTRYPLIIMEDSDGADSSTAAEPSGSMSERDEERLGPMEEGEGDPMQADDDDGVPFLEDDDQAPLQSVNPHGSSDSLDMGTFL